ncbi:MAG TPA: DUF2269 family protein [Acidimicrobiales bacterium]|nr:DUF2269 family protein [Acidimicrobiales bacterium]
MGVDSKLYELVLVLHILAVVIGFGGMFISGFYGNEAAKLPGREGLAVAETTMKVTALAPTMAVYSVPILGILLILLSDDTWKFSEAWVGMSIALYVVLLVLAITVQVPNIRKMIALRAGADGAQPLEMQKLGKTAATVGAIVNVLWVVVVFLMVFKPGH